MSAARHLTRAARRTLSARLETNFGPALFAARRAYAAAAVTPPAKPRPTPKPYQAPQQQESELAPEEEGEEKLNFRETYIAQGATETLFKECARQADYIVPQAFEREGKVPKNAAGEELGEGVGWWYDELKLSPTFSIWCQVTFIHLYLVTVRLRYWQPQRSKLWQKHLIDHFFYEAEHRMTLYHRLESRSIRNRYLKDLYNQWRGILAAYDEGIYKGDAVLATAVWRNIFKADDNADWQRVAQITAYMRRAIAALDRTSDQTIASARVKFQGPASDMALVEKPARSMDQPFDTSEDAAELAEFEERVAKLREEANKATKP